MSSIFRPSSSLLLLSVVVACGAPSESEVAERSSHEQREPLGASELIPGPWTSTYGGIEGFGDVAVQSSGHVAFVATSSWDILVARFDPSGRPLWTRRFGDENYQQATGLAVDGAGNIFVTGDYWGSLDFGGGPLPCRGEPGDPRAFLAKLDAQGAHVWSRCFGDAGQQQTGVLVAASNGDVLVSGYFEHFIDYDTGPIPATGPLNQFVARLAGSTGALVWHRQYDAGTATALTSLALDDQENLYLSSGYMDVLSVDGVPWLTAPGFNVYLMKLDAHGLPLWAKGHGALRTQTHWRLAADHQGQVVATGAFIGTVDHGGGPLFSADGDVFVSAFDSDGNNRWSRSFGGPGFDWAYDVDVDPLGSPVVTGTFSSRIDFGDGPLTSAGGDDVYVVKLGRDGETWWSRGFGDLGNQSAQRVVTAGRRDVVLWGRLLGTLDFGAGPVTGRSSTDSFLTRVSPE
ncbi:SBBP repeat-containing protein [Myxococcus sp. K38C18041901]|uniref:SBBP repeat-containing protein n=1 Tax=Myxococcus guangdongensis TaxID=2906760 RepID=UPI0020A764F0|nr:SBBP repeat-containing protein [Myxococcus guangdongensis]MCP3062535.1 SBBP repeat-containing protein [Myxococcus guangdongensis]